MTVKHGRKSKTLRTIPSVRRSKVTKARHIRRATLKHRSFQQKKRKHINSKSAILRVFQIRGLATPIATRIATRLKSCGRCQCAILGQHYHCLQCNSGEYDLCSGCAIEGIYCEDDTHDWVFRERAESEDTRSRLLSSFETCLHSAPR